MSSLAHPLTPEEPSRRTLALSPSGRLFVVAAAPEDAFGDSALSARLERAFRDGAGTGLFHLGASEVSTSLPPVLTYWRSFAHRFVVRLCSTHDLETVREKVDVPHPADHDLDALVLAAPPMTGAEYLNRQVLIALWTELLEAARAEIRAHSGTVQELLASKHPAWNVVGRVHLHLAENKRDDTRPFAFLASYTVGLSPSGKPQHRPLGAAVRESSSARDKNRLLALLAPVQRAASKSAYVKELVDSGQLFQPLAWTAREAHRFLKEVPLLEESGLVIRVPDWWNARRPPRPQVTVSVGTKTPSALGVDAMLDFSVSLTLDGEELSASELQALRSSTDGLVLLKGKWVDVDRARLDQLLSHWQTVERQTQNGLSFAEGMRLLAGAPIGATDTTVESSHEWLGVRAGSWLSDTLAQIRGEGSSVDPTPTLRAELRPYQREGLRWLWLLSRLRLGACLADDMGLGKTIQVLAHLLLVKARNAIEGPHLLVVPASLIANWKSEAERFSPSLRIFVAHSSALDSKELANLGDEALSDVDLVITSYGSVHRLPWIANRKWGVVVLDEAQAIKNPGIKQTRSVKALKCESRIALTGTPVENRLGDLWSIFDFINPGLLGSPKDFTSFVKRADSYAPVRELVRPYILRRLKTDRNIISDLPEKTELSAYCPLTKRQAVLYQEAVDSLKHQLQTKRGIERRGTVLAHLMRFKQICNHPSQWVGDGGYHPHESGKFDRLRDLCEVISSRQEKVLVFTQFREITTPLAAFLATVFGRPGLVLSGSTAVKQRQELVKRFQEDERVPFFVLSLKAGGTGLNLTAASHVIHFDRWWNPAVENQATDRAFRIGQRRNVLIHKFVCRGTVEERIDALIESKHKLSKELLEEGGEIKVTELDDNELLKLVSLDIRSAQAEA